MSNSTRTVGGYMMTSTAALPPRMHDVCTTDLTGALCDLEPDECLFMPGLTSSQSGKVATARCRGKNLCVCPEPGARRAAGVLHAASAEESKGRELVKGQQSMSPDKMGRAVETFLSCPPVMMRLIGTIERSLTLRLVADHARDCAADPEAAELSGPEALRTFADSALGVSGVQQRQTPRGAS